MKNKSAFPHFLVWSLAVCLCHNIMANEIYQWTDESGMTYFSNTPPAGNVAKLVYRNTPGEDVFQWKDQQGHTHYSDAPPNNNNSGKVTKIQFQPFEEMGSAPEQVSIAEQAEQMSAWRKQREKERLVRKKETLAQQKMARETELLHRNAFIRQHGYGPRPEYYPYAQRYNHYSRDPYIQYYPVFR